jgi:hypothetical protein
VRVPGADDADVGGGERRVEGGCELAVPVADWNGVLGGLINDYERAA